MKTNPTATPPDLSSGAAWLTTGAAAAALGVTERTIQRRAQAGKIPARKVSDASGEMWLVQIAPDTDDIRPATSGDADDNNLPTSSTRDLSHVATAPDADDVKSPTPSDTSDKARDDLMTALIAEKDARIVDLQKQLERMNVALDREQTANAEMRRVLAFDLSNPARIAAQGDVSAAKTGANTPEATEQAETRSIRGEGLAMLRNGLRNLLGLRGKE